MGILVVLTMPESDNQMSGVHIVMMKLLFTTVFIILPSFALSIAGKYLNNKS